MEKKKQKLISMIQSRIDGILRLQEEIDDLEYKLAECDDFCRYFGVSYANENLQNVRRDILRYKKI